MVLATISTWSTPMIAALGRGRKKLPYKMVPVARKVRLTGRWVAVSASSRVVPQTGMWNANAKRFFTTQEPDLSMKLRPPGANALPESVDAFTLSLQNALTSGACAVLEAWGPAATHNVLQALVAGSASTSFEVNWTSPSKSSTGRDRALRFTVWGGAPVEELEDTLPQTRKYFILRASSSVHNVAQSVAQTMRANSKDEDYTVRLHAVSKDQSACNIMAKVLATVSSQPFCGRVRCVPLLVRPARDPRPGISVYVSFDGQQEPAEATELEFTLTPPGAGAEDKMLKLFEASARDRLWQGYEIMAECRCKPSVAHTLKALCQSQGKVAEVIVGWSETKSKRVGENQKKLDVLRMSARTAESWADFNATDFTASRLLIAAATTDIKNLCWAITKDVRKVGAVSVHAYSDSLEAVSIAVKALATVPRYAHGERVCFVPSLGWATSKTGEKRGVFRLFVRRPRKEE